MVYNFDEPIDRSASGSMKWAGVSGDRLAMGLADMDFRAAPAIIDALETRLAHGVFGYTDAGTHFSSAIVRWLADRRGWNVDPDWITPCPGNMPAISHLLGAAIEPGAGVIVQTPAFSPIPDAIRDNGLTVVENPLVLDGGRYEVDLTLLDRAAQTSDVKAFVLCSPHNPSGRVWTRAELAAISDICATNEILVISDEVHAEITFPWAEFVTYAHVAGASAHAIVFGPSKAFNLAGLGMALAVIPDAGLRAALRTELHRVNEDFGVDVMAATALEAAYTSGAGWLAELSTYLEGNLEAVADGFAAGLPAVSVMRPDASFLVWLDCRALGLTDDELTVRIRERAGVVVEPGVHFGAAGSGFVRFNIGTTRANVESAVARMVSALEG